MQLSEWQSLLEKNFEMLKNDRHRRAAGLPVFGLEHNLSKDDREGLFQSIQNHIKSNPPSKNHWLAWVVYASERGYTYDGHEYWQTFEKETVGWEGNDRSFIKNCFITFHEKYHGLKPEGVWARHFSYISGPIRNAILPNDLQIQLVRAIHSSASSLQQETLEDPELYGQLIEKHAGYTTSRFRQLIQEKALVGGIATALFLQGTEGSSFAEKFISPSTLTRLIDDLEIKQNSKDLLKESRRIAGGRIKFGALQRKLKPTDIEYDENIKNEQAKDYLTPILYLRPLRSETENHWELRLKLPNLSQLALNFPDLKDILNNSRCNVEGCNAVIARGRLLRPMQEIRVNRWTSSSNEFLSFKNSTDKLKRILKQYYLPDLPKLFKVSLDGNAYEVKGKNIHAKQKYIFLYDDEYTGNHQSISSLKVDCDGVKALLIELPEVITLELENELKNLEINITETIEVWPAGLTPAKWNVDGCAEWLSTDNPCVKIKADHEINRFLIAVDQNEEKLECVPENPGDPLFIELSKLGIGKHSINISAFRGNDLTTPKQERILNIRIREPLPYTVENNTNSGFLVTVIPNEPTLEDFWEDKIDIEIDGPASRKVKPFLIFYKKDVVAEKESWQPISLPLKSEEWREQLGKFKKSGLFKKFRRIYDSVDSCELCLNAEELGIFKLRLERKSSPIRWETSTSNNVYRLRLHDDNNEGENISTEYYSFEKPDKKNIYNSKDFFKPVGNLPGGLYVARFKKTISATIVCPEGDIDNLRQANPSLQNYERNWVNFISILEKRGLWTNALLPGNPLGQILQKKNIQEIEKELFKLICGANWMVVENEYLNQKNEDTLLNGFSTTKEKNIFTHLVRDNLEEIKSKEPIELNEDFSQALKQTNTEDFQDELLGMSLHLAMNKKNIVNTAGDEKLIKELFNSKSYLVRIARALTLIRNYPDAIV